MVEPVWRDDRNVGGVPRGVIVRGISLRVIPLVDDR